MAKRDRSVKEPTKKQTALNRRERELQRRVLLGVGITGALVVILLATGLLQQLVLIPNSPVASANGVKITTDRYQARVKYERALLVNQLAQYQQIQEQLDPGGTNNFFGSQIQQLEQQLSSPETLALSVLDNMIDETLIRQEAAKRGLSVDPADLQKEVQKNFGYEPDATPTPIMTPATITSTQVVTTSAGVTGTQVVSVTVTPAPTATPYTETEYQRVYKETLDNIKQSSGVTEAEFRALTESRLLRTKLQEAVTEDMSPTEEQIKARHILVSVADTATDDEKKAADEKIKAALARLKNGELFDAVAKEVSDDSTAANGGDLGWFGRGRMVAEFEDAAFKLEVGQFSDIVTSQFGYHIIMVTEKDPARALDESALGAKKDQAFEEFLTKLRDESTIERTWNTSKIPPTPIGG